MQPYPGEGRGPDSAKSVARYSMRGRQMLRACDSASQLDPGLRRGTAIDSPGWRFETRPHSAASKVSAACKSTETSRLTPRSIIVTPNNRCIRLIVTALCVTIR